MNEGVSEADFGAFMDGIGRLTRDVLIPSEPRLEDEDGIPVRVVAAERLGPGAASRAWDGTGAAGQTAVDGRYRAWHSRE